jgi:inorganic pyrophosphatase
MDAEQSLEQARGYIGKVVSIEIDRPLHTKHPRHDYVYELNYGFVPGTVSGDGKELDAYVLGVAEPLLAYEGICTAVLHRTNDNDDKLIIIPEGSQAPDESTIRSVTHFQEQWFKSEIYFD